jgi:hypothetical protein
MIVTQPRIVAACAGIVALALIITYGVLSLVSSAWFGMLEFGGTSVSWQLVSLLGATVLWNISWLWFVVEGFRAHWAWGLGILVFPVASLAFLFYHPQRAKRPALVWLAGTVLFLIGMISTPH